MSNHDPDALDLSLQNLIDKTIIRHMPDYIQNLGFNDRRNKDKIRVEMDKINESERKKRDFSKVMIKKVVQDLLGGGVVNRSESGIRTQEKHQLIVDGESKDVEAKVEYESDGDYEEDQEEVTGTLRADGGIIESSEAIEVALRQENLAEDRERQKDGSRNILGFLGNETESSVEPADDPAPKPPTVKPPKTVKKGRAMKVTKEVASIKNFVKQSKSKTIGKRVDTEGEIQNTADSEDSEASEKEQRKTRSRQLASGSLEEKKKTLFRIRPS